MLVGVGGSGKQSLARLASFICGNEIFQISVTSSYGVNEFKENLLMLYQKVCLRSRCHIWLSGDALFMFLAFEPVHCGQPCAFISLQLHTLRANMNVAQAGVKGIPITFLMTDNQIVKEKFLVYINDLLSTGYIADLCTQVSLSFAQGR